MSKIKKFIKNALTLFIIVIVLGSIISYFVANAFERVEAKAIPRSIESQDNYNKEYYEYCIARKKLANDKYLDYGDGLIQATNEEVLR
ncbi:MAG: hypothetical protein ACFFDI_21410 [Promethearchaeota archaeon]